MTLTAAASLAAHRMTREALDDLAARATMAGTRPSLPTIAPFTGEPLGVLAHGTSADIDHAVARARAVQPAWARRTPHERARLLLAFHDLLLARREELLDLIQLETGKARWHAFEEVFDTAGVARHYAQRGPRALAPSRRRGAFPVVTRAEVWHHPVGVVGIIAPWNYPLVLTIGDALPALLAGNAVVLKPDHQTSFTALWAARLLDEAGLPGGILEVVTGPGPELGPPLIDAADYVMYTGSTATGRSVAARAAGRLIGASLELGGKNPMVVLADADLDRTVEGAMRACFSNAGQLCISMERCYVEQPLYDEFVRRLASRVSHARLGATFDWTAEVGSLQSQRQLDTVVAHVEDAVAQGATVVAGGRARPDLGPFFFEPTVLTDVTPSMRCYADETFGPVLSVYPVASPDEAVARANDSDYGLNASVWSRSAGRARDVARRIQAGTVNINEGYGAAWASTDAPMGGMRQSGLGRRHGDEGLLKYTEAQTIATQRGLRFEPMFGMSTETFADVTVATLRVLRRLTR